MKLFNLFKKKPKELTYEEKMQLAQKQLIEYNVNAAKVKNFINFYDKQVEKILKEIKNDPKNRQKIATSKGLLRVLLSKKMMYSKYSNIITAVKMILETNLNELRLTRGGKLLNAEFIASMEKTLGEWTMATSTIEEATTIEGLEQSFNLYTEMTGDSIGADVIDEIDKLVDEAINAATTKEEINVPELQNEEVADEIERIREKLDKEFSK